MPKGFLLPKNGLVQSIFKSLFLATAITTGAWADDDGGASSKLEPYQISKREVDPEIPKGMYLYTANTGEKWILPKGMQEPPAKEVKVWYWKPTKGDPKPTVREKIGRHEVLNWALPAEEAVVADANLLDDLPRPLANLLKLEREANIHANEHPDLLSLGKFGPAEGATFKVPYIPIPEEELEYAYRVAAIDPVTDKVSRFKRNGKWFVRFFIHPDIGDPYLSLIKKYGIVYHYLATTTSSPRSLIVMDPDNPKDIFWVKPSLHMKIDGSVRINFPEKLQRSSIISEAMSRIPQEALDKYNIGLMIEPVSYQPKGMLCGTIFRTVSPELMDPAPGRSWLPAFSLNAPGKSGNPILWEMIQKSDESPKEFVTERIVRPLLRAFLNLGVNEGMPGELHTQNFYYELNRNGLPTGRLILKDNDGFRFDIELALRAGREIGFLQEFEKPMYFAKFGAALGTSDVPFLGSWYYKLIRNVNGFETLSAYVLSVLSDKDKRGNWNKDKVQRLFDDTAMDEMEKITGIRVSPEDYGYGDNKGLNKALNEYREKLARTMPQEIIEDADPEFQKTLAKEFARLEEIKSTVPKEGMNRVVYTSGRSVTDKSYYVLHKTKDGAYMIEVRTSKGMESAGNPTLAFAILQSEDLAKGASFLKKVKSTVKKATCYSDAEALLSFL